MKLPKLLKARMPKAQDILHVYGVIVCLVYSWTLIISFYRLPSWLLYLDGWQIASVYAYSFLYNFADSFMLLAFVLFLDFTVFLGLKNSDEFLSRAVIAALFLLGSITLRLIRYSGPQDIGVFVDGQFAWWGFTLVTGLPLAARLPKIMPIRKAVEGFAERAIIFAYIFTPLTFAALFMVALRNII